MVVEVVRGVDVQRDGALLRGFCRSLLVRLGVCRALLVRLGVCRVRRDRVRRELHNVRIWRMLFNAKAFSIFMGLVMR